MSSSPPDALPPAVAERRGLSGRAVRGVSGTPECDPDENQTGVAQKEAVWCILAATQEPKMEILAKFHLSAAGTKGLRVQFVQNVSYILLGVKWRLIALTAWKSH